MDAFYQRNFWSEALNKVRQYDSFSYDHGVVSAKLLLKTWNLIAKLSEEIPDRYARFDYRNYILPALAIAVHNLASGGLHPNKKGQVPPSLLEQLNQYRLRNIKTSKTHKKIVISRDELIKNFLIKLLLACDKLGEFDRIGGKEIKFSYNYKLHITEEENNVSLSLSEVNKD